MQLTEDERLQSTETIATENICAFVHLCILAFVPSFVISAIPRPNASLHKLAAGHFMYSVRDAFAGLESDLHVLYTCASSVASRAVTV